MRSSGIHVTSRLVHHECEATVTMTFPLFGDGPKFDQSWACTFAGEVEEWADPEDVTAMWACPRCGTEHDITSEIFN